MKKLRYLVTYTGDLGQPQLAFLNASCGLLCIFQFLVFSWTAKMVSIKMYVLIAVIAVFLKPSVSQSKKPLLLLCIVFNLLYCVEIPNISERKISVSVFQTQATRRRRKKN